jgi:hypothetical protein
MAEPVYGAFGNVLTLDEQEDRIDPSLIYNVYQQEAQTPTNPALLQYTYGTQNNPVFQWVKTIQTGQRTYDPSNKFDEEALKEYEDLYNTGQVPQELGLVTPADIAKQIALDTGGAIAGLAGGQIGSALVDPNLADLSTGGKILEGIKSTFGSTPSQYYQSIKDSVLGNTDISTSLMKGQTIVPELSSLEAAKNFGTEKIFSEQLKAGTLKNIGTEKTGKIFAIDSEKADALQQANPNALKKTEFIGSANVEAGTTTVADRLNWGTEAGKSNWANAAGTAGVSFVTSLAMGEKPVKAAKRAAGSAVGKALGTAIAPALGPVGFVAPIVGTILGSVLGGRVICNELVRQGYMTRKQLVLDYKFTRDYLTPQHVAGYHLWSIWMVKQMRKGRFVKFWKHVATHRANEIAYIYGEKNNPDYLGKVYKKILESSCWFLGYFTKESDWSILYNEKEIT